LVNGPKAESDSVPGADGDTSDRFGCVGEIWEDFVTAYDGCEDEDGFLGGECGSDADARTSTERDEGFACGLLSFVGFEAFGMKGVGIFPDGPVAMEEPRGDEDGATFGDGLVADLVGF
jgi:hypothetical protein